MRRSNTMYRRSARDINSPGRFSLKLSYYRTSLVCPILTHKRRWIELKRILCIAAAVAALSFTFGPDARAQSQTMIGPDLGLWVDMGKIDIGMIADFLVTPEVSIQPGLHFVLGIDNTTLLIFDGNVHYNFALRGQTF